MAHDKLRAQLKTILKRDTAAFIKRISSPDSGPKLSAKVKAVQEILRTKDFGTMKESLRNIMSIVLGEEIPSVKEGSTYYNDCGFIAMMATSDKVSQHEYHLGQVAAKVPGIEYSYSDQFLKQSGRIGGHMTSDVSEVRPATDAEIDAYVDKLTDDTLSVVSKKLVVLEVASA